MLASYQSGTNGRMISWYARRFPSGEYDAPNPRGIGIGSGRPPSSPMVHKRKKDCGAAVRTEAKMTRWPSGVQPRARSIPGCHVRRFASPPAAGTTYTSVLPATVAVYAIIDPSGEKQGSDSTPGVEVMRRA